ncbi:MAG TPA: branched-chain-amino-acid transaminase [Candidatus Omnitrophota bacterium]|nr:branched-chain-amino-acid transaminase [Candidatus Omnitrophota bacterium]
MYIYLNGKFVERAEAKVSVFDHGLLYGDGAFEGIRSYNRLVFKLSEHIDRLYQTAKAIRIDPLMTKQQMAQAIVDTLKKNNLDNAYIRVVVTRGEGDLGLDPKKCYGKPGIIIISDKITLYPKDFYVKGMEVITAKTIRNNPNAVDPKLKTLNYLNNILAKIEASDQGYQEAIMLDYKGAVSECTGDNIFIVKKGVLITPKQNILLGITRQAVLDLAKAERIKTQEKLITLKEVYKADECFLTGTAAEVIPVVKVDGRTIGAGNPGPVTKKLMTMFHAITDKDGVKY